MQGNENTRPFWKQKASKVITYEVTGQRDELYTTQKRGSEYLNQPIQRNTSNKERDFQVIEDEGGAVQIEELYLFKKGQSPAKTIKVIKHGQDSESEE